MAWVDWKRWGITVISLSIAGVAQPGCSSDSDDDAPEPLDGCGWRQESIDALKERMAGAQCVGNVCMSGPLDVVPSNGIPPEVALQPAANNLDVVSHDCRVFLAFRTAPNHFASDAVRLYVVSSDDQENWRYEGEFFMETDLREPRFLSWDGRLFLYYAVLGVHRTDFQPQGMMVSEYRGPGDWTQPEWFYEEGFIPWRTKTVDGVPYMVTYVGGEEIYDAGEGALEVHWLTTANGVDWTPAIEDQPIVLTGGTSETDFVFLKDGTLLAVGRTETYDPQIGWGSKLCRAEAGALGDWTCVADPKKYDSPIMFTHDDRAYIIGRRNLSEDGNFYLGYDDEPLNDQTLMYSIEYWGWPKRCSLWELDRETLEVSFILDLPSKGDTCFPGIVQISEDLFEVYNYTTPLDQPDVSWIEGQDGITVINRVLLRFD